MQPVETHCSRQPWHHTSPSTGCVPMTELILKSVSVIPVVYSNTKQCCSLWVARGGQLYCMKCRMMGFSNGRGDHDIINIQREFKRAERRPLLDITPSAVAIWDPPQEINGGPTERGYPSWWMRAVSRILWTTGPSIKTIRMVTTYIRADVGSFS